MPASAEEVREATEDGVAISHGWGPVEVRAGEDGRVREVVFRRCVRVFDDEGRFAPVYDDAGAPHGGGGPRHLLDRARASRGGACSREPRLRWGAAAPPRPDAKTYQTAEPDIFVGGRRLYGPQVCHRRHRGGGHEAAVSLHRYVQGATLTIGRNPARLPRARQGRGRTSQATTPRAASNRPPKRISGATRRPSGPTPVPLREGAGQKPETARCLGCGASVVDENKCIGCGLCTTKCAFDAIHLHREHPEASTMIKVREDKLPAQSASTRSSGPSRSSSARSRFPRRGMQIWYTSRRPVRAARIGEGGGVHELGIVFHIIKSVEDIAAEARIGRVSGGDARARRGVGHHPALPRGLLALGRA